MLSRLGVQRRSTSSMADSAIQIVSCSRFPNAIATRSSSSRMRKIPASQSTGPLRHGEAQGEKQLDPSLRAVLNEL